jgi:pyridoxal phosphate enzyme (YggS family)
MTKITDNLALIEQQILQACQQSQRARAAVTLLAVTKTKPVALIAQAYDAGQRQFGESYVQEAVEKIQQLAELSDICWHFIGPIQSNKTKQIATHFSWVHSLDREKIATRLNQHRAALCSSLAPLNVCLQVNVSGEESKSGVTPEQLPMLAARVDSASHLTLRGLMAIPEKQADVASYQQMQLLFQQLQQTYPSMDTLSMGMSNDLQPAINAGSTMLRIGSAIFGKRT